MNNVSLSIPSSFAPYLSPPRYFFEGVMDALTPAAVAQHTVFKFLDDAGYHTTKLHDCYPIPIAFREKGAKKDEPYIRGSIQARTQSVPFILYGDGRDVKFYVKNQMAGLQGQSDFGMCGGRSIEQILSRAPCLLLFFLYKLQEEEKYLEIGEQGVPHKWKLNHYGKVDNGHIYRLEWKRYCEYFVKVIAAFDAEPGQRRFTMAEILTEERVGLSGSVALEESNLMMLARRKMFAYFAPFHIITKSPEDIHLYYPPTGKCFSMQLKMRSYEFHDTIGDLDISLGGPVAKGIYLPDFLFITLNEEYIIVLDMHKILYKMRKNGRLKHGIRISDFFHEDPNEIMTKIPNSEVGFAKLFYDKTVHLHRECTPMEIEYMKFHGSQFGDIVTSTTSIEKLESLCGREEEQDKQIENYMADYIKEEYELGPADDNGYKEDTKYISLFQFHSDFIAKHNPGHGYNMDYTRYYLSRKFGLLVSSKQYTRNGQQQDDGEDSRVYGISKKSQAHQTHVDSQAH